MNKTQAYKEMFLGKKIRVNYWDKWEYIYINNNEIRSQDNRYFSTCFNSFNDDLFWEIYNDKIETMNSDLRLIIENIQNNIELIDKQIMSLENKQVAVLKTERECLIDIRQQLNEFGIKGG